MPKETRLDQQWAQLMSLCESEAKFQSTAEHPKLLKLIRAQIDELASQMGFAPNRIATRDFRAERRGDHIARIIKD